MKRSCFLLLPVILLTACVKELPVAPQTETPLFEKGDVPIAVSASLPDGWEQMTKAASDIPNITSASQLYTDGVGVYAYYTAEQPFTSIKRAGYTVTSGGETYNPFGVVLFNRKFSYSGSAWVNSGVDEFWPMTEGENLTFFSYAPYEQWKNSVQTDTTRYDVPFVEISTDNYIASDMSVAELENQKDILWGTNTSGLTHKNVSKSQAHYSSGQVDMHFRHAMAKVGFEVLSSLAGETISFTSTGSSEAKQGETVTTDGETTVEDKPMTTSGVTRGGNSEQYTSRSGNFITGYTYTFSDGSTSDYPYRRPYTATRTFSQDRVYKRTETEEYLQTETGNISRQGTRYMIEEVAFKGFNRKGVLLLDNAVAYEPTWLDTERFSGSTPEYVVNSGNVLATALRAVQPAMMAANPGLYTGVRSTAIDLMDGYFLYAIPREATASDKISVSLKYKIAAIEGTSRGSRTRTYTISRSRDITSTRSYSETKVVYRYANNSGAGNFPAANTISTDEFEFSDSHTFTNETWGTERPGTWTGWTTVEESEWTLSPNETNPSYTVSYPGGTVTLDGSIVTSLIGGYEYTIRLVMAGSTLELLVAPNPWNLTDTDFDYSANENEPIQKLDYDASTIDYVEGGEVFINNRVARFSFLLGAGRYNAWQARFVGSPGAFGFTDEHGEFLRDGDNNILTTLRGDIDPEQMNNLYIKAQHIPASVTSRATLRLYYLDPSGKATVALNLVDDYNEWTLVQNVN